MRKSRKRGEISFFQYHKRICSNFKKAFVQIVKLYLSQMKSVFIRGQRYEERFLLLERKLESCEMNFLHGHRRSRRSCLQIKEKVVGKLILKRNTQILGRSLGIAESKG